MSSRRTPGVEARHAGPWLRALCALVGMAALSGCASSTTKGDAADDPSDPFIQEVKALVEQSQKNEPACRKFEKEVNAAILKYSPQNEPLSMEGIRVLRRIVHSYPGALPAGRDAIEKTHQGFESHPYLNPRLRFGIYTCRPLALWDAHKNLIASSEQPAAKSLRSAILKDAMRSIHAGLARPASFLETFLQVYLLKYLVDHRLIVPGEPAQTDLRELVRSAEEDRERVHARAKDYPKGIESPAQKIPDADRKLANELMFEEDRITETLRARANAVISKHFAHPKLH